MEMLILILALSGIALGCEYNGETYKSGDTFEHEDGCNTCFCAANGRVGCTRKMCPQFCEYNGEKHAVGDHFPHTDGCNKCFCSKGGRIGCTMMPCDQRPLKRAIDPSGCYYGGEYHEVGDTYPADDGCNICSCGMSGESACTKKACPRCEYGGRWYKVGDRFDANDGCNTCVCTASGAVGCTRKACRFSK